MCHEGWTNALDRLVSFVETGRLGYARDSFQATRSIGAPPEAVLAALRSPEAITSWWTPTTGSGDAGGTLEVSFFGGERAGRPGRRAGLRGPGGLVRQVGAPHTGLGRDDHLLRRGGGRRRGDAVLPPPGPHPGARVLRHVPPGLDALPGKPGLVPRGRPDRRLPGELSVHEDGRRDARDGARRSAHDRGRERLVGPATGSADVGGTLEVSFLGGRQRIRMHVEPTSERRVVWSVETVSLTPEWDGTTIIFEVEDADDGATIHFRHQGLTPGLECYDMCHEGWTHYVGQPGLLRRDGPGPAERGGLSRVAGRASREEWTPDASPRHGEPRRNRCGPAGARRPAPARDHPAHPGQPSSRPDRSRRTSR